MFNVPKLLLGNLSMFFDLIFMLQHYVLFRKANQAYWRKLQEERGKGIKGAIDGETEALNKQQGDDRPVSEDDRIIDHLTTNSYLNPESDPVKPAQPTQYH